jgi:hypothetical protein
MQGIFCEKDKFETLETGDNRSHLVTCCCGPGVPPNAGI